MSLISACAQSSTQPVTLILNLRGRFAYSRLPVKYSVIASATGRASNISSASKPATGQHETFRAESPHAWSVVRPTFSNRCQIRGHVADADPVDLHVLSGGQIRVTVTEHGAVVGTLAENVGDETDLAGPARRSAAHRGSSPAS